MWVGEMSDREKFHSGESYSKNCPSWNVHSGNCPFGELSFRKLLVEEMSIGKISRKCPSGKSPSENHPSGNRPRTANNYSLSIPFVCKKHRVLSAIDSSQLLAPTLLTWASIRLTVGFFLLMFLTWVTASNNRFAIINDWLKEIDELFQMKYDSEIVTNI